MPFYSYKCKHCGNLITDIYHKMEEDPTILCPECKEKMVRQISTCNVIFKGDGWPGKMVKEGRK